MTHDVSWSPYVGSSSSSLAGVLLFATVVLTHARVLFRQGKLEKGPGKFLGVLLMSGFI